MLSLRELLKKNFFFEKNWEKFEKKKYPGYRAGPGRAGLPGYSGPGFKITTMMKFPYRLPHEAF